MKLYEVTNGEHGESYYKVFVIANCPSTALEIARRAYAQEQRQTDNMAVVLLCDDTTSEWNGEVRDY